MKAFWINLILIVGAITPSALAQADSAKPPADGVTIVEPNQQTDPDSPPQPQDALNAYDQQMAVITVQAYEELAQIAQAVRTGQISSDQAEHLSRRCFELSMIRLQFLDTLHQIVETTRSKDGPSAKPEDQSSQVTTSDQTVIVAPFTSSPDIPESVAKYLELTPAQIAAIQARITKEQRQVQPLLQQLSENRKAMTTATHTRSLSTSHIRKLAVEQSHILQQLIVANSRLERDVYQILTVEQRKKLSDVGQDTANITTQPFAQQ